MKPHPYQNIHLYPLSGNKSIWPKISVAYFAKWFQSVSTVGGRKMHLFNLPLLASAHLPTQGCKRASIWSLNPAGSEITSPDRDRSRHLFLKPALGPKVNLPRELDMRNRRVTKNAVFEYCCIYAVFHTQNNNHLDQNIGIVWHKRSMLVNDNTAEYNVSQEQKKPSWKYPRWRYRYDRPACTL